MSYAGRLEFVSQPHKHSDQSTGAKCRTADGLNISTKYEREGGCCKKHAHEIEQERGNVVLHGSFNENEGRAPNESYEHQQEMGFQRARHDALVGLIYCLSIYYSSQDFGSKYL